MRLFAALVACAPLAACHKQPDLSSLGSPSQRLVGHWATSGGDNEYYGPVDTSGSGSFIIVHPDGKPVQQHYRLLSEDPAIQTLHINLLDTGGAVTEQINVISEDGESATATATTLGDKVTLAFARVDDRIAPEVSRAIDPRPAVRAALTPARSTRASAAYGLPPNLPPGEYHRVLVGFDGLKPVYAWRPLRPWDKTPLGATFSPSHAVGQRHSYMIWLHATAVALLLVTTLLFASDLGAATVLASWAVALLIAGIGVFLLHLPLIAGVLEILTGLVLMFKAMFQKSDLLS
ncbi:MAG TPA: hypothetical protein VN725_04505 [Rhodanobacteraceae bacterium]|nr:hypothetical protein [Rhodanobacteraceae bacterium]